MKICTKSKSYTNVTFEPLSQQLLLGTPGQCVSPRLTQILRFIQKALRVTTLNCTQQLEDSLEFSRFLSYGPSAPTLYSLVKQVLSSAAEDGPSPLIPLVMAQVLWASARASEFFKEP